MSRAAAGDPLFLPAQSHADLVQIAHRWLTQQAGCGFAFTEYGNGTGVEIPDALGFLGPKMTVLIECKVSRSDFQADRKKLWRVKPEMGLGDFRYFMVPTGVLRPDEIPAGWGFLEVSPTGRVYRTHDPLQLGRVNMDVPLWYAARHMTHDLSEAQWRSLVAWQTMKFEKNAEAEAAFLFSALRRLHVKNCFGILKTPVEHVVRWTSSPLGGEAAG